MSLPLWTLQPSCPSGRTPTALCFVHPTGGPSEFFSTIANLSLRHQQLPFSISVHRLKAAFVPPEFTALPPPSHSKPSSITLPGPSCGRSDPPHSVVPSGPSCPPYSSLTFPSESGRSSVPSCNNISKCVVNKSGCISHVPSFVDGGVDLGMHVHIDHVGMHVCVCSYHSQPSLTLLSAFDD